MEKKIKISLKHSLIGCYPKQRATVRSLGLKKVGSSVVQSDCPEIRGMIKVVSHLVEVKDAE
jgi:large subunit ribosomal protein L30